MKAVPALESLLPGYLFVALAAHSGRPEVLTNWLDPSVTDESDPLSVDPALDPFSPENGPPFSEDFQRKYRAAQRARNERITDSALAQLAALQDTPATDRLSNPYPPVGELRTIEPS